MPIEESRAEYRLRVLRRMSQTAFPASAFLPMDFAPWMPASRTTSQAAGNIIYKDRSKPDLEQGSAGRETAEFRDIEKKFDSCEQRK